MPPRGTKQATAAEPEAEEAAGENTTAVTEPGTAPGESSAVIEPKPGEMDETLANLGDAVAREESRHDLSEAAHQSAIGRMEAMGDELTLDAASLVAGVRDFLLDMIKARPKPWSATSTAEQRDVAAACEQVADGLIRKIVEVIRADGKDPVRVLLEKVTLGGDAIQIAGKVKTYEAEEEDRAVMMLHHARGKHVLLTVASVDDYKGEHREAQVDEEEPELGFEAGGHPEDDSDLVEAAEEADPIARTGGQLHIDNHGLCEIRINLKTGMVEAKAPGADDFDIDVREAEPAELTAERDRIADFGTGGEDETQSEERVEA